MTLFLVRGEEIPRDFTGRVVIETPKVRRRRLAPWWRRWLVAAKPR